MAEWKNINTTEKLDPDFAAIRSLLLDGTIDTIFKLIDHKPTKVAKLLKMSYKTYISKLEEPWRFSALHIFLLAYTVRIDPEVINKLIQQEVKEVVQSELNLYLEKKKAVKKKAVSKKKD